MKNVLTYIFFSVLIHNSYAQTPCENGNAAGFPCNQIDFYAHIDNQTLAETSNVEGNDIWGWTDPVTGTEYALMGQTNGTVFIDLSNPTDPKIIGRLPSHANKSSLWRDIKVYNNFAFIVADDNSGHGMQVFNLSRLRNTTEIPAEFDEDAHYSGVSSAHNIVINPKKGLAYIVGARGASNGCGQGGLHIVDISNPLNPTYAGCFDADGYTHDAEVVTYNGPDIKYRGKEISFNANENTITIADVSDTEKTSLISKQGYNASAYAHQCWLTEDHRYLISNDELDEYYGNVNTTRTLIWDVQDLENPTLINEYFSDRRAIDHNLYISENKIFQSNYQDGLIILDAKKIASDNIRELAYFDTYPEGNSTSFHGTWSNYPFFESGLVIISDIENGFFIVKPAIKEAIETHPSFTSCNTEASVSVAIGSSFIAESYQWQLFDGKHFNDISDNLNYSGTTSNNLSIVSGSEDLSGNKYRCKVTLDNGEVVYSYATNAFMSSPSVDFGFSLTNNEVILTNYTVGADSYEWNFGDGSSTSSDVNVTHSFESCGTFSVTLTATNSCGSSSKSLDVSLSEPVANFSYATGTNAKETLTFNFISNAQNATSFLWEFGDGTTSTEENPSHSFPTLDSYTVSFTASNSCGDSTYSETIDLDLVLSAKRSIDHKVLVYPNPVKNTLNVQLTDERIQIKHITIYNASGSLLESLPSDNQQIETTHWEKGLYLMIIEDENGRSAIKRIIKN